MNIVSFKGYICTGVKRHIFYKVKMIMFLNPKEDFLWVSYYILYALFSRG